jgi:hypothetical protein
MNSIIGLYSSKKYEINKFIKVFYDNGNFKFDEYLKIEIIYKNPIDIIDIIGVYVDNKEEFNINMWISLDIGIFINVTTENSNSLIKYIYNRFRNNQID